MRAWWARLPGLGGGKILDELFATTGCHRNHARKALVVALKRTLAWPARRPRTPVHGTEVLAALQFCWAVLGAPTGKRLAPAMTKPGSLLKSQIPIRTSGLQT